MDIQTPVPIAIIGIACHLPGNVKNTDDLWNLLIDGRNAWSPVPPERFNENAFYHPNPVNSGTTNHRGGHFLSQDISAFDAPFFSISPIEASALDPQQRVLLETTYEVFEDAGIPVETARGSDTAVFTAMFTRDYDRNLHRDPLSIPKYHSTGTGEAIVANRVSYIYDFKGPSMTLDTGCSGSMVALHQACRSLQVGESTMALASGVNIILNPDHMFGMSNLHMLNGSGRSFSFDERGSGYGRGEGVVTVLLKRLDDALRAGDRIRAVIRNTAVNQDGKTTGITLPSSEAQESLERHIYRSCGLNPNDTTYIEAHGTGTTAGDLAELNAISKVFCGSDRGTDLYVGSIKSNIGHLESSSGLAGLIKAVIILEKGIIPPNSDFNAPKQGLKLKESNIKILSEPAPWPNSSVRRASVNSFGYGGTNAHAILESACEVSNIQNLTGNLHQIHSAMSTLPLSGIELSSRASPEPRCPTCDYCRLGNLHREGSCAEMVPRQVFIMSAKSQDSLRRAVRQLHDWAIKISSFSDVFADLARTLSNHRSLMGWRYSLVAGSSQELISSLKLRNDNPNVMVKSTGSHRVAFVFTGQGAQSFSMGRELLHTNSEFAESIRKSDRMLKALGASWSLLDELSSEKDSSRINESEIAQPASTALQVALVDLLSSLEITPQTVFGHSSGEIGAAYAAGIISQAEALKVSYHRSFIRSHCKKLAVGNGAMLSVGLGEEQVLPLLIRTKKGRVSLACVNSPSSTTISGDEAAVLEIQEELSASGVFSRLLTVDTAYHSHHMQLVADRYLNSLGSISFEGHPSRNIQFISTVTGAEKITGFGSEYWVENLISKVRFSNAVEQYCAQQHATSISNDVSPDQILIEIGPHSVLKGPIRQTIASAAKPLKYHYLSSLVRGEDAGNSILKLVGNLFEKGYPVNIDAANSIFRCRDHRLPKFLPGLPTYAWDHSNKYWHESRLSKQYRLREHPYHDLLGVRIVSSTLLEPAWTHMLGLEQMPWLAHHVVDGLVVFPGSGYMCMAIEAIRQLTQSGQTSTTTPTFVLKTVSFSKALVIPPAPSRIETQISLRSCRDSGRGWYEFQVSALGSGGEIWHEHCHGLVKMEQSSEPFNTPRVHLSTFPTKLRNVDLDSPSNTIYSDDLYKAMQSGGNLYGPCFRAVRKMNINGLEAVGFIEIPDVQSIMPANYIQPHIIHPTTLDALLHTSLPLYSSMNGPGSVVPIFVGRMALRGNIKNKPQDELSFRTVLTPQARRSAMVSLSVFETCTPEARHPVLEISELEVRGLGEAEKSVLELPRNFSYQMKWNLDIERLPFDATPLSLHEYISLLHFKYSNLKILQANSGFAQIACSILTTLARFENGGPETYDFIGFIAEDFNDLRNKFPDQSDNLHLKTVDIRNELEPQGPEISTYDLVILNTNSMGRVSENAIPNARKLLRSGGWLMLLSEKDLPLGELRRVLAHGGFEQMKLLTSPLEMGYHRILISRAVLPKIHSPLPPICILNTEENENLARQFCTALQSSGLEATLSKWEAGFAERGKVHVVIDDGQNPFLVKPLRNVFKKFTDLLGSTDARIFWISAHRDVAETTNPKKALITGFTRSASAENEHLRSVILDIQDAHSSNSATILLEMEKILVDSFGSLAFDGQLLEKEFIYRDGRMMIPRLVPNSSINTWIARETGQPIVESIAYSNSSRALKLDLETVESGESLYFIHDELPDQELEVSEVQVVVKACPIHPLESAKQSIDSPAKVSPRRIRQFSGVITSIGKTETSGLDVGDRVCGWSYDDSSYPSHMKLDQRNVIRLPSHVSFRDGSTIPFAFMTAYYSLMELAHLQKGQTVLIHNAAGDTGRVALSLAKSVGARIIATVLNKSEKNSIMRSFDLEPEKIFDEHATNLKHAVLHLTEDVGVDAILNLGMSDCTTDSSACVADYGIYIYVRLRNRNSNLEKRPFVYRAAKSATFVSFDLDALMASRPERVTGLLRKAGASITISEELFYDHNKMSVAPGNLHDAFKLLLSQKFHGQIFAESDSTSQVKVITKNQSSDSFKQATLDPNATYVIAGGLGDIGQRLCNLMVHRGAKYIVLLSRRSAHSNDLKSLTERLNILRSGCHVSSIACDISCRSMVQNAATEIGKVGFPPVKGIIQSASVLQDTIIERMSAEDLDLSFKTKLYGTAHLSEMFHSSHLDFFVMLSSLSGVMGTMGQANYNAGNTYQDAMAQNHDFSQSHFMSLDLGLLKDTSVYDGIDGRARMQNLIRQGTIPINSDELDAFLDYAISPEAQKDQCRQAVMGIDGASIADAINATSTTKSPIFIHVRKSGQQAIQSQKTQDSNTGKLIISASMTPEEAHIILATALVEKISILLSLDPSNISLDSPLLDFGMDSLTAIDLKNWISREYNAAIQASEILDEHNIPTLAVRIATRSSLLHRSTYESPVGRTNGTELESSQVVSTTATHRGTKNADDSRLYKELPIPDLMSTLETYLISARVVLSESQISHTESTIDEFMAGPGIKLHNRLVEARQDNENWPHAGLYLRKREPIHPHNTFYGSHIGEVILHTQAERAAIVSLTAWDFKQRMKSDSLAQDYLNEEPLCMDSWKWIFHANRNPHDHIDQMRHYQDDSYFVVLRRGHIFKVKLGMNTSLEATFNLLKLVFTEILSLSSKQRSSVATLTADERNSWAKLRKVVKGAGNVNAKVLQTIEASMFAVCLDDDSPETPTARCNQFLYGNPSNRWSDKTFQLVICANGISGFVCEHTMLDAASLNQMNALMAEAIMNHEARPQIRYPGDNRPQDFYDEIFFETNSEIDDNIRRISKNFTQAHTPATYIQFHLTELDNNVFQTSKISPKAGCQLAIQVASLLHFGQLYPCWETLTTMLFRKGRIDWMQVVSPAMKEFCTALTENQKTAEEMKALLRDAVKVHSSTLGKIGRGKGFLAHLHSLREMVKEDEPLPAFFEDPTWKMMMESAARKIKTDSSVSLMTQDSGFHIPDPAALLVHYEVEEEKCLFWIQGTGEHPRKFQNALNRAASMVRKVLDEIYL